jgi:hypothetical protein
MSWDIESLIDRAGGVRELGQMLGVARTTVLTWRAHGLIPGSRIGQISRALKIPVGDLLPLIMQPRSAPEEDGSRERVTAPCLD